MELDQNVVLDAMGKLCTIQNNTKCHSDSLETAKNCSADINELQGKYKKAYNNMTVKFYPRKTNEYKRLKAELNILKENAKTVAEAGEASPTAAISKNSRKHGELVSAKNVNFSVADDIIIESDLCSIDPLTKRPIQEPVKNIICGHYYEKTAIMQIINRTKYTKCPVAGCGNHNKISTKHLFEDKAFKLRLQQLSEQRTSI